MTKMNQTQHDIRAQILPVQPSEPQQVDPFLKQMGTQLCKKNCPVRSRRDSTVLKRVQLSIGKPEFIPRPNIEWLQILYDPTGQEHMKFYKDWLHDYGMSFQDLYDQKAATGPIQPSERTDVVIECKFRDLSNPSLLYLGLGTREPNGISEKAEAILSRRRLQSIKKWFSGCPEESVKRISDLDRLLYATETPIPRGKHSHVVKRIAVSMILNAAIEEQIQFFG